MQQQEICQCGRPTVPVHCTECGSTNLYSRRASGFTVINGKAVQVRGFRCRRCDNDFSIVDSCKAATLVERVSKRQEAEDNATILNARMDELHQDPTWIASDDKEKYRRELNVLADHADWMRNKGKKKHGWKDNL